MTRVRNLMGSALLGLALSASGALAATYVANLDGLQENPPHATPAIGQATAVLTGNVLSFSGAFSGLLANYTASHIHAAPAGVNGGVVFPLNTIPAGTSGMWMPGANDLVLTAAQVATLQSGGYYVNVHSQVFPGGEIRGQLLLVPDVSAQEQPAAFTLEQNHPNPFNPTTTISLSMAETSRAKLTVYNVLGEPVATLIDGMLARGRHEVLFNALDLPSGRYVYSLEAAGQRQSRGMLLVK